MSSKFRVERATGRRCAAIVSVVWLASVANAQFVNASFEDPSLGGPGFTTNGINGWSTNESFGVAGVYWPNSFSAPVPDGNQIGYSNGSPVAQQSTSVLGLGETNLTMYFGRRFDGIDAVGTLELWAGGSVANGVVSGGTLLDSVTVDETTIASGQFQQFDAAYFASAGDPSLGALLSAQITFTSGSQMDFDLAAINSAPEPASMALLGLGAAALVRRRLRRT